MTKEYVETFLEERYVIFNTVAGVSVMAVILEELEDSFVVGLPARLVKNKNTITAEPYLPKVVARFYKSTLLNHVALTDSDTFELPYLSYVIDNGDKVGIPEEEIEFLKAEVESITSNPDSDVVELPSSVDYIFPEAGKVQ